MMSRGEKHSLQKGRCPSTCGLTPEYLCKREKAKKKGAKSALSHEIGLVLAVKVDGLNELQRGVAVACQSHQIDLICLK